MTRLHWTVTAALSLLGVVSALYVVLSALAKDGWLWVAIGSALFAVNLWLLWRDLVRRAEAD